jgi:hypothetical protein
LRFETWRSVRGRILSVEREKRWGALARGRRSGPDPVERQGGGTIVSRRQPDGTGLIVVETSMSLA